MDPHWSNVDQIPQNLINADPEPNPDPDPGRIQVNKTYFSKHFLIFRSKKRLLLFKFGPKPYLHQENVGDYVPITLNT